MLWRALGDDWVVCARRTGAIVQLDALSAALLSLLEAGPAPASALVDAVHEAGSCADRAQAESAVHQALRQLVTHDLIVAPPT